MGLREKESKNDKNSREKDSRKQCRHCHAASKTTVSNKHDDAQRLEALTQYIPALRSRHSKKECIWNCRMYPAAYTPSTPCSLHITTRTVRFKEKERDSERDRDSEIQREEERQRKRQRDSETERDEREFQAKELMLLMFTQHHLWSSSPHSYLLHNGPVRLQIVCPEYQHYTHPLL